MPPQTAFGLAQDDDTLGTGASTPPAGRSGTTGSQPDDRQQFQLSTGNRPQSDVEQGSGRIWQRCTSMPLECTPAAGGQRGKPQPHPPLVDVDRVERLPVPGHDLLMFPVQRIQRRLEELHETGGAPDVLRRAAPLAVDERRVVDIGLAIADRFDEDVVPPVVAARGS